MISLNDADLFFATHPLQHHYLAFDKAERFSAIVTAERDVCAALKCSALTQTLKEAVTAAVCEQALFLLLNPEYLTGQSSVSSTDNLSARARALLPSLSETDEEEEEEEEDVEEEEEAACEFRFSRG